jgi:HD superfamily phosphohydrolase
MHELTSTGVGSSSVDKKRIILMMEIFKGNGEINGYAVINNKGMQSIESYVLSVHLMYEMYYLLSRLVRMSRTA